MPGASGRYGRGWSLPSRPAASRPTLRGPSVPRRRRRRGSRPAIRRQPAGRDGDGAGPARTRRAAIPGRSRRPARESARSLDGGRMATQSRETVESRALIGTVSGFWRGRSSPNHGTPVEVAGGRLTAGSLLGGLRQRAHWAAVWLAGPLYWCDPPASPECPQAVVMPLSCDSWRIEFWVL
jgi:hypothetical protein